MPTVQHFTARPPNQKQVEVYVIQLADGRVIARTAEELQAADDTTRIAAGLPPRAPAGSLTP